VEFRVGDRNVVVTGPAAASGLDSVEPVLLHGFGQLGDDRAA
jgi:hypothetical protein